MVELIDVNVLLGRHPRQDLGHDGTKQALLASMDRFGIGTAWVGNVASWLHDPATGNQELLDAIADEPRLRPVWVAIPHHTQEVPPPDEYVEQAKQAGVVAFRVYPTDQGFSLDGRDLAPTIDAIADAGLPLIVGHAQTTWPAIEAVASRREDLRIVVLELGYRSYRQAAGVLSRTVNVHLDIAYLAGHRALEWLAENFGPEHLVFGTGYPGRDPGEAVTRLFLSELNDDALTTIATSAGLTRPRP